MTTAIDITGLRFGKLVAVERIGRNSAGAVLWRLQCDCGGETTSTTGNFRAGNKRSCKCGAGKSALIHGMRYTRLYSIWQSMKQRCFRKSHPCYHRYGGRGITICQEWLQFEPFRDWALANGYSSALQIDRTNNDGNYEPANCRFVTPAENMRNRSCSKKAGS